MKKLTILLILIFAFGFTNAQIVGASNYNVNPNGKQYDTIKVFMLVSYKGESSQTNSVIGYEVIKFIPEGWRDGDRFYLASWSHESYLTDKKKPISNNIIVWQSKNF